MCSMMLVTAFVEEGWGRFELIQNLFNLWVPW